ncbi:MAG: hypothetical protein U0169_25960 [Polyangiaceae bacterium]
MNEKRNPPSPLSELLAIAPETIEEVVEDIHAQTKLVRENLQQHLESGRDLSRPRRAPSLKERCEAELEAAIDEGLITYSAEFGRATVFDVPLPPVRVGDEGWGTVEWWDEHHRTQTMRARCTDLAFMLKNADLHHFALRRLNAPTIEAGMYFAFVAAQIAEDIGLLASGGGAVPDAVLERIRTYVEFVPHSKTKTWERALMDHVRFALLHRDDLTPIQQVHAVLELLSESVGNAAPTQFFEKKPEHLRAAERCLKEMRHQEVRPSGDGLERGRSRSSRGAAHLFAKAFGVSFEPKASRVANRKR